MRKRHLKVNNNNFRKALYINRRTLSIRFFFVLFILLYVSLIKTICLSQTEDTTTNTNTTTTQPLIPNTIIISSIEVNGNEKITKEEILSDTKIVLNTEIPVKYKGTNIDSEDIKNELKRIIKGIGYFEDVTNELKLTADNTYNLIIKVKEYPVVKKVKIEFQTIAGKPKFKKKEILDLINWPLQDEKPFNTNTFAGANKKIIQLYEKNDMLGKIIDKKIDENNILTLKIGEGIIKEIIFSGNTLITSEEIKIYILSKAGDMFSFSRLEDDINRLTDLDYFKKIDYDLKIDKDANVSIILNFKEKFEKMISAVEIKGNKKISKAIIKEVISMQEGDIVTLEKVQKDVDAIYALGFFQEVIPEFVPYLQGTKVVFKIRENPSFDKIKIVGCSIKFEKNKSCEDTLLEQIFTQKGEIINTNLLAEDVKRIESYYKRKSYLATRIYDNLEELTPESKMLTLFIDEGMVEDIRIEGEKEEVMETPEGEKTQIVSTKLHTKNYVILREMKTKVGEVLNFDFLKRDLEKIYNLGFFDDVQQQIEPGTGAKGVILVIKIRERKTTGSAMFGAGYSSQYHLTGQAQITKSNLFGKGRSISIGIQFGGVSTYELSYYEPWLDKKHTSLSLSFFDTLYKKQYNAITAITNYDESSKGFGINLGRPIAENITASFGIQSKKTDITQTSGPYVSGLASGLIRSLSFAIAKDSRDNIFDPKVGVYNSLSLETAGGFLSGNVNFLRIQSDIRRYLKFTADKLIFANRLQLGYYSGDDIITEQFILGGAESLRGYDEFSYTGTKKFLLNSEFRLGLGGGLTSVFFVDSGFAWAKGTKINFGDIKTGIGLGIRYLLPGLGPVRIDYGYSLKNKVGQLHLSFGQMF